MTANIMTPEAALIAVDIRDGVYIMASHPAQKIMRALATEVMRMRDENAKLQDVLDDLRGNLNYLRTQATNGTLHPQVVIQNVDAVLASDTLSAITKEPPHER